MEWTPRQVRTLRAALRLSQDDLARLLQADAKSVRNWENGRHHPYPAYQRALDRTREKLSATQQERFSTLLGNSDSAPDQAAPSRLASPESAMLAVPGQPSGLTSENGEGEVHRRAFLERGVAAGAAIAVPDAVAALSEQLASAATYPEHVDQGLVAGLRELVPDLCQRYYDTPPAELFGLVAPRLSEVSRALGSQRSSHRELCALAGELAGLGGWLARDLGHPATAKSWLDAGLRLAERAGDQELRAYLLEALTVHYKDSPEVMLSLVQRANALLPRNASPTLRAFLAAREAEEQATFGDARAFRRAIVRAEKATEQASVDDRSRWVHYWGPSRLLSYQGVAYLRLGQLAAAQQTLAAVLPALPPALIKGQAFVLADLATVHARQGDIEQSCRLAQQALDAVAEVKTPTTIQRVTKLRAELEPFASRSDVRDLGDRLRAA